jgi:hypothetical protein
MFSWTGLESDIGDVPKCAFKSAPWVRVRSSVQSTRSGTIKKCQKFKKVLEVVTDGEPKPGSIFHLGTLQPKRSALLGRM